MQAIEPGQGIPRGYGVAWIEPGGWTAICYPFGLHIAVRWLRLLYEAVQIPRRTWWEKRLLDASDLAYDCGVVIGKSLGPKIDSKQVFSKSQLNRRIAVAVGKNNAIVREPLDEAFDRGYRIGWEAALTKLLEFADLSPEQRRKLIEKREAALAEASRDD